MVLIQLLDYTLALSWMMMNCILPIIYFIYQFCPLFMMNRKSRLSVYLLCVILTSVHFILIMGRNLGHELNMVIQMMVWRVSIKLMIRSIELKHYYEYLRSHNSFLFIASSCSLYFNLQIYTSHKVVSLINCIE